MANLVENLQSIYSTKQQIKDVLNTQSDVFSDYPDLIRQRIEEGGSGGAVLGEQYIDGNGVYEAKNFGYDGFSLVNVNVPQGGEGGYEPRGTEDEPLSCKYAATVLKNRLMDGETYHNPNSDFGQVVVAGVVSQVFTTWNAGFPQCRFDISDDGQSGDPNMVRTIRCYNVYFEGYDHITPFDMYKNPNVDIGDYVVVVGQGMRYYDQNTGISMFEIAAGGNVIKHTKTNKAVSTFTSNGQYLVTDSCSVIVDVPQEGGGEVIDNGFKFQDVGNSDQPWTCLYAKKISDEELMDGMYWEDKGHFGNVYVGGIVTEVQYTFSEQYPSARFTIADGPVYDLSNGAVKCFGISFNGYNPDNTQWNPDVNNQIEVGDYVIVAARFTRYFDAGLGYSYPELYGGIIYRHWKPGKEA